MSNTQTAIFGGGCFWCTEAVFLDVEGVESVESGYIGGHTENPTYRDICTGNTGHAEAIKVAYNADKLSYSDLLAIHLVTHDPTQLNRQGNDVGTQYRSSIFPQNAEQREQAEHAINVAASEFDRPIVTTVEDASIWYPAEDYHQNYWEENGRSNPYCLATIPPKLKKLRQSFGERVRA